MLSIFYVRKKIQLEEEIKNGHLTTTEKHVFLN